MNQLTSEEAARVFAMYEYSNVDLILTKDAYYDCSTEGMGHAVKREGFVFPFHRTDIYHCMCYGAQRSVPKRHFDWSYVTSHSALILTPLSSISDEHAIEVCRIEFKEKVDEDELDFDLIEWGKSAVLDRNRIKHLDWDTYQYLIQQGYAVPLFFGVGHWANGKTAIELGIAIDKTTVNV